MDFRTSRISRRDRLATWRFPAFPPTAARSRLEWPSSPSPAPRPTVPPSSPTRVLGVRQLSSLRRHGRWQAIPVLLYPSPAVSLRRPRRASSARSRKPWSPSPAPAARPRSPPSPGRSGSMPAMPAASIGTTGVVAPGRNEYGSLTTPDPVALHQLLAELADAGVTHAVDGSLEPRARPAPPRRREARRRRLHQSRPRPHGLSSDGRGLSSRQDCACSIRCCRRARRPSSSPTIRGRSRRSRRRARPGSTC